jgi:hypothetical protein
VLSKLIFFQPTRRSRPRRFGPSELTQAPVWTQPTQPAAGGGTPAGGATPAGGGTPDAEGSS